MKDNQYWTKAPSSFRSLISNSSCSCLGRRRFSTPYYLPWHCFPNTQAFRQSPLHQLWILVHRHIWNISSPSKLKQESKYHREYRPWLRAVIRPLYTSRYNNSGWMIPAWSWILTTRCVASSRLWSNAQKYLIIPSGYFPSWWLWGLTSAQCILVAGNRQECLWGCGV